MHFRIALLAALLLGSPGSSTASPFGDAAERLNGEWRSGDFVLRIDARRAQASTASDRPFEWQRFIVKEVAGNEIVFSVGAELFEAVIDADTLVLSGTDFRGERVLFRGTADGKPEDAGDVGLRGTTD
jgi:hypothetical protein